MAMESPTTTESTGQGTKLAFGDEPPFQWTRDVVRRLEEDAAWALASNPSGAAEVAGVLLGRGRATIDILDCQPLFLMQEQDHAYALNGPGRREFERAIAAFRAIPESELSVVGFYRSHLGDQLELTEQDRGLLRTCFRDTCQVTLLINVTRDQACRVRLFLGDDGRLVSDFHSAGQAAGLPKWLELWQDLSAPPARTTERAPAPAPAALLEAEEVLEPEEVLEAAEISEPAQLAQPAQAAEAIEVAEGVEIAEPAEIAEPGETAEAAETAEAVETAEAAETAEAVEVAEVPEVVEVSELAERAETIEPAETVEHAEVAEAAEVWEPAETAEPVAAADEVAEPPQTTVHAAAVGEAEAAERAEAVAEVVEPTATWTPADTVEEAETPVAAKAEPIAKAEAIERVPLASRRVFGIEEAEQVSASPRRRSFRAPAFLIAAAALVAVLVGYPMFKQSARIKQDTETFGPAPLPSQASSSAASDLGLQAEKHGDDLLVEWNRSAPLLVGASRGMLIIREGNGHETSIMVDGNLLRDGSIVYRPVQQDVSLRLVIVGQSGTELGESVTSYPPRSDSVRSDSEKEKR